MKKTVTGYAETDGHLVHRAFNGACAALVPIADVCISWRQGRTAGAEEKAGIRAKLGTYSSITSLSVYGARTSPPQ